MLFQLKPEHAALTFTADGADTFAVLRLDCVPADERTILEIGYSYAVAPKSHYGIGKRKLCDVSVWTRRKSALTSEAISKLKLSESKIGELGFYPPVKGEDFIPDRPATIEASLFISDELHESLLNVLQTGRRATRLDIEIRMGNAVEYGWEPDGSRIRWNVENTTDPSYLDIEQVCIGIDLFG